MQRRTVDGAVVTFATVAAAKPTVSTSAATNVLTTTATLTGTVNPNGSDTTYRVEYGTSTGYGSQTAELDGGWTVLDLPSREAALEWAAKFATACRCAQEVREFGPDPAVGN